MGPRPARNFVSLCKANIGDHRLILEALATGGPRRFGSSSHDLREVYFTQQVGGRKEQLALCQADAQVVASASPAKAHPPWSAAYLGSTLSRQLASTFLPSGYPASVAPGYLRFVWWQGLHHFAGSVNGVLASTFLLYSVGLGAGAIPTAGALNWVLKDGLGQLGTLLFGKAIAHSFDVSTRSWYLAASAKLNLAMGLEVCTLLAPQWFLPMGAAANAVKGLAWMSGGSSRSAFNVAFAADNNIADITAKATSQTICTSMAGTAAGIALASAVGQSVGLALASFAAVGAVHMYTSYVSVRCVPLATLNPARLQLLLGLYLGQLGQLDPQQLSQPQSPKEQRQQQGESGQLPGQGGAGEGLPLWKLSQGEPLSLPPPAPPPQRPQMQLRHQEQQQEGQLCRGGLGSTAGQAQPLPTPWQVAQLEPILPSWHSSSGLPRLHIGASLLSLYRRHAALMTALLPLFLHSRHILVPTGDGVYLVFHEQATAEECILAVLHAHVFARSSAGCGDRTAGMEGSHAVGGSSGAGQAAAVARVCSSLRSAQQALPGLLAGLAVSGWNVSKVVLESRRNRACW